MRNRNGNIISTALFVSIAASVTAIVACLVMIFVNSAHLTSNEITNGLSATFDACESVSEIAEIMSDMFGEDGEEAVKIAEIDTIDFRVTSAA